MATTEAELKLQILLQVAAALTFLTLAGFCMTQRREGTWALLGLTGGSLFGLANGLVAASYVEIFFLDSFHIADDILNRDHVNTVLALASAFGAVLVALAFVRLRRAAAGVSGGPTYGP